MYALTREQPPGPPYMRTHRPGSLPQEAGTSSPAARLHPGASVATATPLQRRDAANEAVHALLVELNVPNDPGPTDFPELWNQLRRQPELASRFQSVFREMLRHANLAAPERVFDLPLTGNQLVLLRTMFNGLEELRQLTNQAAAQLEADINQQQMPLGHEIYSWSKLTGMPIEFPHAFDHDDNAVPFARVLGRLRTEYLLIEPEISAQTKAQVSSMLHAVANDAALRREVFSLAQDALGTCNDNLAEGFSKMALAVDNHRMARAVERGDVDVKWLDDWAGSLFRLSLLETAVHRYIASRLSDAPNLFKEDRNRLIEEPMETMLHAKVELRRTLGLPSSTASTIEFHHSSILNPADLRTLAHTVRTEAENPAAYSSFLLDNPTWRAGMKALHPQEFQDLKTRQDEDPFYDLDLPPDTDVVAQAAYAEKAQQVAEQHAEQEQALLLRLAVPTAWPPKTEAGSGDNH
ncbi:E3 ligase-like protein (putative virulence factor) [Xylophilus ampelinus]|uniref:E3 ligase-like protein (Putative virulence factor) n=2 Tax=Xylophilus ampelinus TaxID=54067 RepID=A0A318SGV8_9BURK|nr:E3 ligase-like protein (putative virulence factor) [Xylophilus ampelinus]